MSAKLAVKRDSDRHFIEQLLDTSKLDSYMVPVAIKADLRKYQQVKQRGGISSLLAEKKGQGLCDSQHFLK